MTKKRSHFDIAQFFEDCGYKVSRYPEGHTYKQFYAKGNVFYIRNVGNVLQFGIADSFDRWANSIDFFTCIPNSERQAVRKLSAAIDFYEANYFDNDCGQRRNIEEETQRIGNPKTKKMWQMRQQGKKSGPTPSVQG